MAIFELRTFSDLISAVLEELKIPASDTVSRNKIKRDINTVYVNEVVPYEQWKWIRGYADLYQEAYFSTGTASIINASNVVTVTTAPAHSRKGYWFTVDGFNEVYRVAQHTANSTTVTLESPFVGTTNTAASFKIWTDKIPLPVGLRDTVQITHNFLDVPLEGMGLAQYRKYIASAPKAEGRAKFYTTADYTDPAPFSVVVGIPTSVSRSSAGLVKTLTFNTTVAALFSVGDEIEVSAAGDSTYNGEWTISSVSTTSITFTGAIRLFESTAADAAFTVKLRNTEMQAERCKELWVYPALYSSRTTLHVDYAREVKPLEDDDDEPLMPIGDRIVLLYGALMRAWSRERNPEEATRNQQLYERKLMKMAGKLDDSTDYPVINPSKTYLAQKRRGRSASSGRRFFGGFGTPGAASPASSSILNTANTVAIFDASGELDADPNISTTELLCLNGIDSNIQDQLDAITTLADGKIYIGSALGAISEVTPTGDVTISNTGVTAISAGVIVNADVSGSAAIAYSKLNLSDSIVNADVNTAAAIAFSKMAALTASKALESSAGGVVAVATGTGYPKLASGTPSYSATIPRADVAVGTASHVIINDGSGNLSSEAQLDETRGGTGLSSYTTGDVIYASAANTLAKLAIGTTAQRLAVSAGGIPEWASPSAALSITSQTTTYSIATNVDVVLCSGSAFTATLPDAVANVGKVYEIKKTDSSLTNIITIATTSSQTIISATSPTTTTLNTIGETLWVVSDGANWQVLCRYAPGVATSFTPTGTWNTGITYTGFYTRRGSFVRIQVAINCSTTPNSATLTVNLPSGISVDTAALAQGASAGGTTIGYGSIKDGGSTAYPVTVVYSSTTVVDPRVHKADGTYTSLAAIDQATPLTFDNADSVHFIIEFPVSGWNG